MVWGFIGLGIEQFPALIWSSMQDKPLWVAQLDLIHPQNWPKNDFSLATDYFPHAQ